MILEVIFMCFYVWVLVLVDAFDEWVFDFYNGGQQSGEDLGVWLSNVKQLMNLIFIVYLELVEDLLLGFVMVGIVIYVVVLWVS